MAVEQEKASALLGERVKESYILATSRLIRCRITERQQPDCLKSDD